MALPKYDWLHLHHEDFTGQYGKFYASYRNANWYQEQVKSAEADAANNGATLKEKNVLAKKPSSNSAVAINDENSPENWLKNIENLRKQGELDAVRKNLKAFKLRYPDYTLPKDLIEISE